MIGYAQYKALQLPIIHLGSVVHTPKHKVFQFVLVNYVYPYFVGKARSLILGPRLHNRLFLSCKHHYFMCLHLGCTTQQALVLLYAYYWKY